MKKIIAIILMFISTVLFSLMLIPKTYASETKLTPGFNESDWYYHTDGYMYYQHLPTYSDFEKMNILITAPESSVLEYYDVSDMKFNRVYKFRDGLLNKVNLETNTEISFSPITGRPVESLIIELSNESTVFHKNGYHPYKNNVYEKGVSAIRYYLGDEIDIPSNDDDYISVADLPITTNSKLGKTNFVVDGKKLVIKIQYDSKDYFLKYSFKDKQDMSIFVTKEAWFINVDQKIKRPQIIINHDTERLYLEDILLANNNKKPAFVPHTIWDLMTNELETITDYKVNVFIKQNTKGLMMAYVYIDEFVMDKIISATLSWTSRQKNGFPANILMGKYTEWETIVQQMFGEEYFRYRDLTSDWQNYIPVWNIVRGIYQLNTYNEIPRITEVNLNRIQSEYNITRNEIEGYYSELNDNFDQIKDNEGYKLWAFALQEGKSFQGVQTEIYNNRENPKDQKNFQIFEIKYKTNGVIYEALGSDMSLKITADKPIDGIANEEGKTNVLLLILSIAYGLIVIGTFWSNRKSKNASSKSLKFIFAVTLFMFAGYFFYIYYLKSAIFGTIVLWL